MIKGVAIHMTTEELAERINAKADWYDKQTPSRPEEERARWTYDAKLLRYVASHLAPGETFELNVEDMRVWVHFDAGLADRVVN